MSLESQATDSRCCPARPRYPQNISDILTRYTHPALDIIAWLPYGLLHFVIPFVIAAVAFVFGPRGSINFWAKAFGIMNLLGVITQILVPCTPPCASLPLLLFPRSSTLWNKTDAGLVVGQTGYELIHGLTPAYYGMKGSAGGLARIDAIFGGSGYTETFSNAPIPFGAFPSLHSGSATIEALFLTHFFPRFKCVFFVFFSHSRPFSRPSSWTCKTDERTVLLANRIAYWIYVAVLYWVRPAPKPSCPAALDRERLTFPLVRALDCLPDSRPCT